MKRLFKKLLIPTLVGSAIIPIASCASKQEEEKAKGSIEIVSNIENMTVGETEDHISQPIQVKCIDGEQKELGYSFDLKLEGNDILPEWISITDNNEIKLTGGKNTGTYTFYLSAFNENEKLYSNTKTFVINVISDRHIVPTSLDIKVEDGHYFSYGKNEQIPITITPFKEGVEEQYLLNEVSCFVAVLSGQSLDLNKNKLFEIDKDEQGYKLKISKNTDKTYIGDCGLLIVSQLKADPNVISYKEITVHIDNTSEHYDPTCKCTFTRAEDSNEWELSKIDSDVTILHNIPSTIMNWPVTRVANEICKTSGIKNIVQVILPESVYWIGTDAFYYQTALNSIEMPGVTYVGPSAFAYDSLLEIRAGSKPPKFDRVETCGFLNCSKFAVEDQENLTYIGKNAFKYAGLRKFYVGEKCKLVGDDCFNSCDQLEEFQIKTKQPPQIGAGVFKNCGLLPCIKIPAESMELYNKTQWKLQGKDLEGI